LSSCSSVTVSDRDLNFANEVQRLRATKLAEAALERYGLGDARLHFLRQGFVQVFRVVSPTEGECALRMYSAPPVGSEAGLRTSARLRSPDTLQSQLLWLSALGRETDLLVPEPVALPDGSLIGYVSFDDLPLRRRFLRRAWRRYRDTYHPGHPGRYCVLLGWVPGRHKRADDLTPADLSLLGSYVAGLHRHAEQYSVPQGAALPRWDWEWPFGESVPLWNKGEAFYSSSEMAVFEEIARRTRQDLEGLGHGSDVFGLIHRDLKLDNVVFHGRRVGAIDFDMCGLGHYLLDLAVPLDGLRLHYSDRFKPMREALFEGYESVRRLPQNYEGHLKTFAAMLRVASTHRDLTLLGSEATRHQSRGHGFLRNSVTWLQRNYLQDRE
jgi:hypothetical protein